MRSSNIARNIPDVTRCTISNDSHLPTHFPPSLIHAPLCSLPLCVSLFYVVRTPSISQQSPASSMGASQSTATLRDALSRLRKETVAADDAAFWDGVWSVKGKRRRTTCVCVCVRICGVCAHVCVCVCVVLRERGVHTCNTLTSTPISSPLLAQAPPSTSSPPSPPATSDSSSPNAPIT